MKCPKCGYLGFETGDRCRNCRYDFSLVIADDIPDVPMDRESGGPEAQPPDDKDWLARLDEGLLTQPDDRAGLGAFTAEDVDRTPATPGEQLTARMEQSQGTRHATEANPASDLPLFGVFGGPEEPLIAADHAPRPPLAVRRRAPEGPTADRPTGRAIPGSIRERADGLTRLFDPARIPDENSFDTGSLSPDVDRAGGYRRIAAGVIDVGILCGVTLVVVYLTLRVANLSLGEWRVLPAIPMLAFLGLIVFAYAWIFTAVGGQTVGKMATGVRVVSEEGRQPNLGQAGLRALVFLVSAGAGGLGYLPAFTGQHHRALHDRLTGTRVVDVSSA